MIPVASPLNALIIAEAALFCIALPLESDPLKDTVLVIIAASLFLTSIFSCSITRSKAFL